MEDNLNNWKSLTDKKLQNIIQNLVLQINNNGVDNIDLNLIWDIVRSKECLLNVKLRFGLLVFLGIVKYSSPLTLSEMLEKEDDEVLITALNGVIDCKQSSQIFPLSDKSLSNTTISQLNLAFTILSKLYQNHSNEYFHIAMMAKRTWDLVEREYRSNNVKPTFERIEELVDFFLPLLDSSICGLPGLICEIFTSIIKWSKNIENIDSSTEKLSSFFIDDLLHEFFPDDTQNRLSYPLCKIHLRYLKIVVRGVGAQPVLSRIPLLFDYLLQSSAVNYIAPLAGDVFSASLIGLDDRVTKEKLISVFSRFAIDGCQRLWYEDDGCEDLMSLNVVQFFIPSFVECCADDARRINNELMIHLRDDDGERIRVHRLFFWVSSFGLLYAHNSGINPEESQLLIDCLNSTNDQIRITAYKIVCDNYSSQFSQCTSISLATIFDVVSNNLTIDNPSFRNHFASATKRLLVSVRDSVIPHLTDSISLRRNIEVAMANNLFRRENPLYLESFSWVDVMSEINEVLHKDICVCLMFCRYVYCNNWSHSSTNYQRQKSMSDLISSIREVFVDPQFFIDKKSGFNTKTVQCMREFYQEVRSKYIVDVEKTFRIFIDSLKISKPDIQSVFYTLLIRTHRDNPSLTRNVVDMDALWSLSQTLCHSNQPVPLSSGSFLVAFLSQCDYRPPSFHSVTDYLLSFLEELAIIDMDSVLQLALKRPGHGFLQAMELLLKDSECDDLMKSDRVCIAANRVIEMMLKIMGCDKDEMASFQKIGVTLTSLTTTTDDSQTPPQYQHLLSWSWQVLRVAASILVLWCRQVDRARPSPLFLQSGHTLLRVLLQTRHRGTIESVSVCLQAYLATAECSSNKKCWLSPREVAIDHCIEVAVLGSHSVTRRSAGLPLVLMAALGAARGRDLARDCLQRLITLARGLDDGLDDQMKVDPPLVHCLNLVRHMCAHPGLLVAIQPHHGNILLLALDNFSSRLWPVRNAALQLFTTMVARLAALTRVNPAAGEILSVHRDLYRPIVAVLEAGGAIGTHQTLVPALTLLANLQFCRDRLLPTGMSLGDIRDRLWPLLGSEIAAVRRLAAKCVVRTLPNSVAALDVVKEQITVVNDDGTVDGENRFAKSHSRLHGELLLLEMVLKNLQTEADVPASALIRVCESCVRNRCWPVLTGAVSVLSRARLSPPEVQEVATLLETALETLLHGETAYRGHIGRQEAVVALVTVLGRLRPQSRPALTASLVAPGNGDILQYLAAEAAPTALFPPECLPTLLDALRLSLLDYRPQQSPYLVDLVARVTAGAALPRGTALDHLGRLLLDRMIDRRSETVAMACCEILTRFVLLETAVEIEAASDWMGVLEDCLGAHVPEETRLRAAKTITMVTKATGEHADRLVTLLAPRMAATVALGCYDECRTVRDEFRAAVVARAVARHSDVIDWCVQLAGRARVCPGEVLVRVWRRLVETQCGALADIDRCRSRDALYEPIAENIYLEDVLLLERLFERLRLLPMVDDDVVMDIEAMHPPMEADYKGRECIDSPVFVLAASLRLLRRLRSDS